LANLAGFSRILPQTRCPPCPLSSKTAACPLPFRHLRPGTAPQNPQNPQSLPGSAPQIPPCIPS
jgi:hypothetical protein